MNSLHTSHETSSSSPADAFSQRVRNALRPLLPDDALLEHTALKIERRMAVNWKFTDHSSFFDYEGKVGRVVAHFAGDGLTRDDYVRAAMQRIELFIQNPATLIANIEGVTNHFDKHGLTRRDYVRGALKHPQIFYQKPRTLISNIERVVTHFETDGLTCEDYLRAATNRSSLFCRKPETIIRHVDLITDLYRKGFLAFRDVPNLPKTDAAPVLEFLVRNPQVFNMSEDNIALRERYARITNAPPSRTLLLKSRRVIEERIAGELPRTVALPANASAKKPVAARARRARRPAA